MYAVQFLATVGVEIWLGQGEELFFGQGIATLDTVTFNVSTHAHLYLEQAR